MVLEPPTVIATGLRWAEGPLWVDRLGALLVSDVKANTIWRLTPCDGEWTREVFLRPSGFTGPNPPGEEHGANGLTLDAEGRLVLCSHGERGLFRLDEDRWLKTPLLLRHRGLRINSPNDVACHPTSGALYATDPPYGLSQRFDDPRRETEATAIYRIDAETGAVTVATDALEAPNGIAFAPDGRTAYATNSAPPDGRVVAFDVHDGGAFGAPRTLLARPEATYDSGMPDGLAVGRDGTLFAAGPEGIDRFDPDGTYRGVIEAGGMVSNVTCGQGGTALFATAADRVLRFELG